MGPIVHGEYAQRFLGVRDAFAANFETGREVGASFAATVGGEFVVDIWAGHADQEGSRPWERDTITCIRSITKSMAALCAHILVDRGRLDFDTPVAEYWPEFGQAGKSAITPRHILSHSAGIAVIEEPLPANAVFDWERMIAAIEKQRPLWEPGTQHGYHGTLFGFLVGELVRRISGKTVGTFFRDEVAGPLDADVHIGLPKDQHARAVEMFSPSGPIPEESGEPASELEALLRSLRENPALWEAGRDWLGWLTAEIPSANGYGNARSVARVMSVLACNGEVDGLRLLGPDAVANAFRGEVHGRDLAFGGDPIQWGLGFQVVAEPTPFTPNLPTIGHGAIGGSGCAADLDARVSWAYISNNLLGPEEDGGRMYKIGSALYEALSDRSGT